MKAEVESKSILDVISNSQQKMFPSGISLINLKQDKSDVKASLTCSNAIEPGDEVKVSLDPQQHSPAAMLLSQVTRSQPCWTLSITHLQQCS
jgi:hypothetical protein